MNHGATPTKKYLPAPTSTLTQFNFQSLVLNVWTCCIYLKHWSDFDWTERWCVSFIIISHNYMTLTNHPPLFLSLLPPHFLCPFLQTICRGVWVTFGGLHLCTLICTHPRPHRGPFTGRTATPSWWTCRSVCWWKETSSLWDLAKRRLHPSEALRSVCV